MTMNSWKSTLLSACAPPLRMFIIGTGSSVRRGAAEVAIQRQALLRRRPRARPRSETPRIALAPSFDLFAVPSSSISVASIAA